MCRPPLPVLPGAGGIFDTLRGVSLIRSVPPRSQEVLQPEFARPLGEREPLMAR